MPTWIRSSAAWLLALAVLHVARTSSGYCRTTTCELGREPKGYCPPSEEGCGRDENCCATDGKPLFWKDPCIEYAVQQDGSIMQGIDADQLAMEVQKAFDRWQNVNCPGGGSPRFRAQLSGFVTCDERQTVCASAARNVSLIVVRDSVWIDGQDELANTTPAAILDTGEIVDADLQLNLTREHYSVEPGTPGAEALANVLTHEIGHFLGIDHSNQSEALMFYAYQSTRSVDDLLGQDDIEAICEAFPPGKALSCAPSQGPAYDECVTPEDGMAMVDDACIEIAGGSPGEQGPGCSVSNVGLVAPGPLGWGALLGLGLLRRRRCV